ncbi:MAG TPA: hypothetical protein H9982_03890 [Candidatus Barnesiella excrementipullorum]|uniref:Uncharacterized protein n=1 Tax=Candidatus Barnesiella excrementipullorum TaxID=2838479 RepID=A0A9D1VRM7_9BACT|nr:hypothetical protein [Candidatus Barnesiella excrementipullorum]
MRAWAIVFVAVMFLSCTRTVYVPVTERRNVYTTVRDTVIVLTERGDTIERITPDTVSLIACKGAESEARVAGGVLYHRLVLQERHDSVRVEVREQLVIDSVPYPVYVDGASQRPVSVWIWRVVAIAAIVVAGVCLLCGMRR